MINYLSNIFFLNISNNNMLKTINKITETINIFKNINRFASKKIKIVFYSEGKTYLKYSYLLIEFLSKTYPNQILYVSSDKEDRFENPNIKNLYVGKKFLLQYFFFKIKAQYLFMTTTDLGNNILKKTKNVEKYIYYFHAPVSTTKVYTSKAFDNYDVIFCNGDYQVHEIRKREDLKNLKKKQLFKSGYFYFDYLKRNLNLKNNNSEILVAPSWNYNEKNFINENFEEIIEVLLRKNYNVRFRPHPEHIKRSGIFLNRIKEKFKLRNFVFDLNIENIKSMEQAQCLVTDNSGIAIEFTLILKKPVLYFKSLKKIHNEEIKDYDELFNLEDAVEKKFGYKFEHGDIEKIDQLINNAIKKFSENNIAKIDEFLNKNFYNVNNTVHFFEKNIHKNFF